MLSGRTTDWLHHPRGDAERLDLAPSPCAPGLRLGRRSWPRSGGRWSGHQLLLGFEQKINKIGLGFLIDAPQPRNTVIAGGSKERQRQLQKPRMGPHLPGIARAELTGVSQPPRARLEPPRSETGAREAYKHPMLVATRGEQHWLTGGPLHMSVELVVRNRLRCGCSEPCSVFSRGRRQPPRERVIRGANRRRRLLLLSLQGLAQCGVPRGVPEAVHLRLRHLL